ncbi:MAG: hypothetical protein V8R55_14415 [Dysosmobacter sp.]
MASNEKYTILYGRLSQEDTQKTNKTDDSNSIQNQKLLLEKYTARKASPTRSFCMTMATPEPTSTAQAGSRSWS